MQASILGYPPGTFLLYVLLAIAIIAWIVMMVYAVPIYTVSQWDRLRAKWPGESTVSTVSRVIRSFAVDVTVVGGLITGAGAVWGALFGLGQRLVHMYITNPPRSSSVLAQERYAHQFYSQWVSYILHGATTGGTVALFAAVIIMPIRALMNGRSRKGTTPTPEAA